MNEPHRIVYMCDVCLRASAVAEVCHPALRERSEGKCGRTMVQCDAGCAGDECTQPVIDVEGHLLTRAPRWWIFRHRRITLSKAD